LAAVVKLLVITVEPLKATVPVVSETTTLAAVRPFEITPPELVTVTVFNAVVWPTLLRVMVLPETPGVSRVRFCAPLTLAKRMSDPVPRVFKETAPVKLVETSSKMIPVPEMLAVPAVILAPRFKIPAPKSATESPAVMFAPLAMVNESVATLLTKTTSPVAPAVTGLLTNADPLETPRMISPAVVPVVVTVPLMVKVPVPLEAEELSAQGQCYRRPRWKHCHQW